MSPNLAALFYLASGVLFILALRGLSSPESSRQGNMYGMLGMTIAVLTTFTQLGAPASFLTWVLIIVGIGAGGNDTCTWIDVAHGVAEGPGSFRNSIERRVANLKSAPQFVA